jgi:hypothetical protein
MLFDARHYLPILKTRSAEFDGFALLTKDVRDALTPILELTPVPLRFPEDARQPAKPAKSLDEHVEWILDRIKSSLPPEAVFIDGFHLEDQELSDGSDPTARILSSLREAFYAPIPVFGADRVAGYLNAVRSFVQASQGDACLRITAYDFREGFEERIDAALGAVAIPPNRVHVLIDFGPVAQAHVEAVKASLVPNVNSLPHIAQWKSIALAASGFPPTLSELGQYEMDRFPRTEWEMWKHAAKHKGSLSRLPTFSDYVIGHPELLEFDPRTMTMAPKLKYTDDSNWLIAKGKAPKRRKELGPGEMSTPNREQLRVLAEMIVGSDSWKSPEFSAGDLQIARYASGEGPHDAKTCVVAGVTHHLTLVVRQLASFHGA